MIRRLRDDRGTIDVLLLVAMLGLVLAPAVIVTSLVDQLDAGLVKFTLWGAGLVLGWKAYKVADVLLGLDARVKRLEEGQGVVDRIAAHLGIDPES